MKNSQASAKGLELGGGEGGTWELSEPQREECSVIQQVSESLRPHFKHVVKIRDHQQEPSDISGRNV